MVDEPASFASVADLETRWPDHQFTGTERERYVQTLLEDASDLIRSYPSHIRCNARTLQRICCAVVRRAIEADEQELTNVRSMSETVGPVSQNITYGTASGDLRLWPSEERQLGKGKQSAWSYDPLAARSST